MLFDLDDTLYDHTYAQRFAVRALWENDARIRVFSVPELLAREQRILTEVHRELVLTGELGQPESRVLRMKRLYRGLGVGISDAEARRWTRLRREVYLAHQRAVPGARTLLRHLRARGKRTAIVSNNLAREQRAKIARIGLEGLFDAVVVSDEVGAVKPDPRIFRETLDRLGCRPGSAVFVGDSWNDDVRGARAAGIRPVWFNRSRAPLPRPGTTAQLARLTPLREVLTVLLGPEAGVALHKGE